MNEVAETGALEQMLPSSEVETTSAGQKMTFAPVAPVTASSASPSGDMQQAMAAISDQASSVFPEPASGVEESAVNPAVTTGERLEIHLQRAVMTLRQSSHESLSVVVKTDTQTELHLQLRQQGDIIEVTVQVARGSLNGLEESWDQLQQKLAQSGVRLRDLEQRGLSTGGSFYQGDRGQHSTREESSAGEPRTNAFRFQPPTANKPQTSTATRAASPVRGWETWA